MGYTKGEWRVDPDYDWVRDDNGWIVANCTGRPDSRALAHLIAALPRMYEALEEIREVLSVYEDTLPQVPGLVIKAKCDDALAKAEGKETQ